MPAEPADPIVIAHCEIDISISICGQNRLSRFRHPITSAILTDTRISEVLKVRLCACTTDVCSLRDVQTAEEETPSLSVMQAA
jgi:hypothetical protein